MGDYYGVEIASYLRRPPGGIRRSAYEVERIPWARRGEVEAALLYRGTIVSAYGYVETRLAELAIRLSKMPEYEALRDKFPSSIDKRIAYLRRAFALPPLAPLRAVADRAMDRFEAAAELRHIAAHARMQVLPDWGVSFEDFHIGAGGMLIQRRKRHPLAELEAMAWNAARLSRMCQYLLDELDLTGLLPPKSA